MWYKIFIEDEFINYFSDEYNTFTITENGKQVLAPTFFRFARIVRGVTAGWAHSDIALPEDYMNYMQENEPDLFRGYTFCKENKTSNDRQYLSKIWSSIPRDQNESPYDVDLEKLNAEQCAVLLMYPFWSRMDGHFEISFQEAGRLKKYLLALKKKADEIL